MGLLRSLLKTKETQKKFKENYNLDNAEKKGLLFENKKNQTLLLALQDLFLLNLSFIGQQ